MNPRRWLAVLAFGLAAIPAGADTLQGVLIEPRNPTTLDRIRLTVVGIHNPFCPIVWPTPPVIDQANRFIWLSASNSDCGTPSPVQEELRQTFEIGPLSSPGVYRVWLGFEGPGSSGYKAELLRVRAPEETPALLLGSGGSRFQVVAEWKNHRDASDGSEGSEGAGYALPLAEDSGAFWFFHPENLEATVKILDGRQVNGHWWVFIASMTDLEMKITVYEDRNGCFDLPVFPPACPSKTYVQTAGRNRNFIDVNFSAE